MEKKFNILDILQKKNKGTQLSKEEIDFFVKESIRGNIEDYKITTLLTAIYINGMNNNEIFNLTKSMTENGKTISLKSKLPILDKHSTGGVGDKVSLIICPLLASFGIPIAKLSGKGLGITGGTIDKLNSVGVNTSFSKKEYEKLFKKYSFFIMEQTSDITPSDKIYYSLRNDTSTVDSIPLITSSIMSKKLAVNSEYIYIDVKVGNGAFFKNIDQAITFSKLAINIGKKDGRKVSCYLTDMNGPLGSTIGNKIEVFESLEFLRGNFMSVALKNYLYDFISDVLIDYKIAKNKEIAIKLIDNKIEGREPYKNILNYFKECGSKIDFNNWREYKTKFYHDIVSDKDGYLYQSIKDNYINVVTSLKMGRISKKDKIDEDAGILIFFDNHSKIKKGDKIARIYSSNKINQETINNVKSIFEVSNTKPKKKQKIISIIK